MYFEIYLCILKYICALHLWATVLNRNRRVLSGLQLNPDSCKHPLSSNYVSKTASNAYQLFTSEDSGGHDLLSQDFEIFHNKVNSCLVKTPNIRGNKTAYFETRTRTRTWTRTRRKSGLGKNPDSCSDSRLRNPDSTIENPDSKTKILDSMKLDSDNIRNKFSSLICFWVSFSSMLECLVMNYV